MQVEPTDTSRSETRIYRTICKLCWKYIEQFIYTIGTNQESTLNTVGFHDLWKHFFARMEAACMLYNNNNLVFVAFLKVYGRLYM